MLRCLTKISVKVVFLIWNKFYKKILYCILLLGFMSLSTYVYASDKTYVGSKVCMECHEHEYENFMNSAKKANSYGSIKVMKSKLTDEEYKSCFECHTTGYGKVGGFISEKKTPELKNAGCEVCHGPGSLHAESNDIEDIKYELSLEDCTGCHNSDRVQSFDFKPLLFGGAH